MHHPDDTLTRRARLGLYTAAAVSLLQWIIALILLLYTTANGDAYPPHSRPGELAAFASKLLPLTTILLPITALLSAYTLYTARTLHKHPKRSASIGIILSITLAFCTLPCCLGLVNIALLCALFSTIATARLARSLPPQNT